MAFRTYEQGIESACELVESERGERATHLQLLVVARLLAAEARDLRAMRARALHIAEHHPDPSAAGAALRILGQQRMWEGL